MNSQNNKFQCSGLNNKNKLKTTYYVFFYAKKRDGKQKTAVSRSRCSQMFFKMDVLKNFANFIGKHLCWSLFLIKLQAWRPVGLQCYEEEIPTQLFTCEIWEIFKNTFFYRTSPVAASGHVIPKQEICSLKLWVPVKIWKKSKNFGKHKRKIEIQDFVLLTCKPEKIVLLQ